MPTPTATPDTPTNLTGVLQDNYAVALDWDDSTAATSYQLSYRQSHVTTWVDLPTTGMTVAMEGLEAVVSGLEYPLNYYFRVNASNSQGSSGWSSEVLVTPSPIAGSDGCEIETPPANLSRFDKYCSAGGIGVVGSAAVSDFALKLAWNQIMNMLVAHPGIHEKMAQAGVHHLVDAAADPRETPRYSHVKRLSRSPEQNLLCYTDDSRPLYSLLVHEFAHAIEGAGLSEAERGEAFTAYTLARQQGLWEGTYAASDNREYWADAVEAYFSDATTGANLTHTEMAEHDPRMYSILLKYLPVNGWRYSCPESADAPTPPAKPPAPINLRATAINATSVTLAWGVPTAEAANVQRYVVFRSQNGRQSWWSVGEVGPDQFTFTDTNLEPGRRYDYLIAAHNGYRQTNGSWETVETRPQGGGSS